MLTKSLRVPIALARSLAAEARRRQCSESDLIREGIERVTAVDAGLDMRKLLANDIGVGNGPVDLSTGKRHRAGYGTTRHR